MNRGSLSDEHGHETVVVGVSASAASAEAVRWAAGEARRRGARLHAVHVVEHARSGAALGHLDVPAELDLARCSVPARVAGWLFRAGADVELAVSVVTGDLADQLAREAGDASLVVLGESDSGRSGEIAVDVSSRCLCPVAIVGGRDDVTYVDVPLHVHMKGARHARA